MAELEYLRDTAYPVLAAAAQPLGGAAAAFSGRSEENARQAKEDLFSVPEQPQGARRRPGRPARPDVHGASKEAEEKKLRAGRGQRTRS